MTKTEYRNEWESRVVSFKSSGMGVTVWCKANDVNKERFKYPSCLSIEGFKSESILGGDIVICICLPFRLLFKETCLAQSPIEITVSYADKSIFLNFLEASFCINSGLG